MSRFRPVIGAPDTSNFSNTAQISQEGRNRSADREVETQKAIADIVNERNKVQLTKRAQDIESLRIAGDLNNQIASLEQQSAIATKELALKAEAMRTELLSAREGRAAAAAEGALEREAAQGLQTQRLGFEGVEAATTRQFTGKENALDRAARSTEQDADRSFRVGERIAGQQFAAGEGALDRSFRGTEQSVERGFRTTERIASEKFQAEENERNRKADLEAMRIKQENPDISDAAAAYAGEILIKDMTPEELATRLSTASNTTDKKELERATIERLRNKLVAAKGNKEFAPVSKVISALEEIGDENLEQILGKQGMLEMSKLLMKRGKSELREAPAAFPGPTRFLTNLLLAPVNALEGNKPERLEAGTLEELISFFSSEASKRSGGTPRR